MDRHSFLRLVLPEPDGNLFCFAAWPQGAAPIHAFSDDLDELLAFADKHANKGKDAYFALATFDPRVLELTKDRRTQVNARHMRALFIDMDGYDSPKAAAQALGRFLPQLGLPQPTMVSSGGGLHAYWPLTANVDIVTWYPVAENLKRLCKQEGLKIDESVTADAARVLRVPDTWNFKPKYERPLPVKLRHLSPAYEFDDLARIIREHLKTPGYEADNVLLLPGVRPTGASKTPTQLLQFKNQERYFRDLVNLTAQGEGCQQLAHFIDHAHEQEMEPQWRAWLSIAKECTDADKAINKITGLHPSWYDRVKEKLTEIKGPYGCPKFDSVNTGGCTGCKHKGKIANPLALITKTKTTREAKEVEYVEDVTVTPTRSVHVRPEIAYPYSFGDVGGMFVEETKETGKKTTTTTTMFLAYDLYITGILEQHETKFIQAVAWAPKGKIDIVMPVKALADRGETCKFLADRGVIATNAYNQLHLHSYLHKHANDTMLELTPTKLPSYLGWQPDGSFVCGNRLYQPGMPSAKIPMVGMENVVDHVHTNGTLEDWRAYVDMLTAKGAYEVLAGMLASAAAPLMEFTGFYGITVHLGSSNSGTGKSVALASGASIWGDPGHYKVGKGTSHVAMQHRLGVLHSLPLITDEVTIKTRDIENEWLPQFLLDMTEGKGKERMESNTNKERRNMSAWRTVAIMSSNTHWTDLLTSRQHSAEGELRRLLEIKMDKRLEFTDTERTVMRRLNDNYGHAGQIMSQWMVDHRHDLREQHEAAYKAMFTRINATDDERFWVNFLACILQAGIIWKEAGIASLPLNEIIEVYVEAVENMRIAQREGERNALDILSAFIADNYGNMIVVQKDALKGKVVLFGRDQVDMSLTRGKVRGRLEIEDNTASIVIPIPVIKGYCTNASFSYANLKKDLSHRFRFTADVKRDLGAGTKIGAPMRSRCIVVEMDRADVHGLLPAVGEA